MRAILIGGAYPRTLLTAIIQRIAAESGRVTARRVAMCKAVVNREIRLRRSLRVDVEAEQQSDQEFRQEVIPVALDRNNLNQAYRLGRLFALLERLQELALPGLNATIRDRSFAGASSTPAHVFPLLIKTSQHHAATARKDPSTRKLAYWLENQIGEVWSGLDPNMPRALRIDDQARFAAGYYHQRFWSADNAGARNLAAAADVVELDGENDKE
jgi:CRISPR-associated protein Csd1